MERQLIILKWYSLFISVLMITFFLGGFYLFKDVKKDLADRPKIISIDMAKLLVQSVPFEANDTDVKQKMERKMLGIQRAIDAFVANGYVVIDKNAVVASSDLLEITESDIKMMEAKE